MLADLVDRHDVRVVELGDGLGLVLEPRAARPAEANRPARIIFRATGRFRLSCRAL